MITQITWYCVPYNKERDTRIIEIYDKVFKKIIHEMRLGDFRDLDHVDEILLKTGLKPSNQKREYKITCELENGTIYQNGNYGLRIKGIDHIFEWTIK